jgi:putative ABC transport system permease protein
MASSSIGYVRVAWRMLLKQPGLALGRILTITVVITAMGAVLTVANAIFLRPLPFPDADRLVRLYLQPPGTSAFASSTPHYPFTFMRFRERAKSFERFEGIWVADRAVTGNGEPDSVSAGRVSAGFFAALGGNTRAGRVFTEQEVADDVKVAVLSDGFWQRRFGGDLAVIGSTMVVDGESHTIIGVIRAGFDPAFTRTEFWTPLNLRAVERVGTTFVQVVGVLQPGVTAAQAESEMAALFPPIQDEWPAILKRNWRNGVLDLREARYGSQGNAVLMLLAAVIGLALLAIANLANLTLADVMFRRTDFAVRAALGASRAEIAAPEVVQAVIVAVIGAAAGLGGASLLVPALFALDPSNAFTADAINIDWRVAIAAVVSAAAIMIVAVAVPVLRFAGPKIASDLTTGSRRAIGGRSSARTRVGLVVVQTAMALVLLSSSALIVRTLLQASEVDPGFDARGVVTAQIRLNTRTYPTEGDRTRFVEQMLERVRSTPGVIAAGTTLNVFLVGSPFFSLVQIEHQPQPDGQPYTMQFRRISPGYFDAMKTSILQGRDFTAQDRAGKPLVAMVSRSLADRFWPGSQAIGKRLKRGADNAPWIEVVGVVEDVRDVGLDLAPADTVYTPVYQGSGAQAPISLVVRTEGDPLGSIQAIRRAVWAVDPNQPLSNILTLEGFLSNTMGAQRFRATLISACGLIGLLLATIGTYGVTARSVVERTKEVGVRLALGGRPRTVWWAVASTSIRAILAGAVAGVALSALARAALAALLPELQGASHAFSFVAAAVLLAVGTLAAVLASRRATSIDPLNALRGD